MSTADNTLSDVEKIDNVKDTAESECVLDSKYGHPEHGAEECKHSFIDQNKNMTTSCDSDIVNTKGHYIDEAVTVSDISNTYDVLSENTKRKILQEHVTHADDETKEKKKEKKLNFFTFGKNKTKQNWKVTKTKRSECGEHKEDFVFVQTDHSGKDSSKSKEVEVSVGNEALLISKSDSENRIVEKIPPPATYADLSIQDVFLNREGLKSKDEYRDSVCNNSVNVNKNSDPISNDNEILVLMKQDEAICSSIPSDSVNDMVELSGERLMSRSDKQNQTGKGKSIVNKNKANTADKKKKQRWSFSFGDSRKKPQNLESEIIFTNSKELEKKHGKFRRLGIRAISQSKINDEDSRTSSLQESEKHHDKTSKKSPPTLKSLKLKGQKKKEKLVRKKSSFDIKKEYKEIRSSSSKEEESSETYRRRRSLVLDEERRIEESDAFEGVSLSSLDDNDASQKNDSHAFPQKAVKQKESVQRNVSCQGEPASKGAFADVIAQQILESVIEAVKTQEEQSVKSPTESVIPQIFAHQSVHCLKDSALPVAETQKSLRCTADCVISTRNLQKHVDFGIPQLASNPRNDIIDAKNIRQPSVSFEKKATGTFDKSGNYVKSLQIVDTYIYPAATSLESGYDAVISAVSAHIPEKCANNDGIHSSTTGNFSACTSETAMLANITEQSSDLEKGALFLTLSGKESAPLTKKTIHPGFINPQRLSIKENYSDLLTDDNSRKGNMSCVATTGSAAIKRHKVYLSSGHMYSNERDKTSVAQGIPVPCIHEAVQSFQERQERISSVRDEKLNSKIVEHEKICLTSMKSSTSLEDKPISYPENEHPDKLSHKGKGKHANDNVKNQMLYANDGNVGSHSGKVFHIASEIEKSQELLPDAEKELLQKVKRSKELPLPIAKNIRSSHCTVQICKDVGVQVPDVYLPLDDVFGFSTVPAENCRHVGVQFPETAATSMETDQRSSKNKFTPFYI